MNETSREIFENYEIRKTASQKKAFIEYAKKKGADMGYSVSVECKKGKAPRNIVVGSPESAKVIFTAHYDTCPRLPFPNFITPKNILIYILYQLVITVAVIAVPVLVALGISLLCRELGMNEFHYMLIYDVLKAVGIVGILALMMIGPANPHTANDNTSGVITLFEIMGSVPEELRRSVAFVFFDLEELGLVGSSYFASKRKKKLDGIPVVNFDCVSDGKCILFALKKSSKEYEGVLKKAFKAEGEFEINVASKGVFYPSDQANFKRGIGVAALKKSRRGILYMDKIHTAKDIAFAEENIEYLKNGAVRLCELLADEDVEKA